jgi:hypothetical protein
MAGFGATLDAIELNKEETPSSHWLDRVDAGAPTKAEAQTAAKEEPKSFRDKAAEFVTNSVKEITDIGREATGAAAAQFRPNAPQAKPQSLDDIRQAIREARDKGHLAGDYSQIPAAAGAAVASPAQSIGGRFIAESLPQVGDVIHRVTGWDTAKQNDPEKLYQMGREAVGTALTALPAGKTGVIGHVPEPPPEPPPPSGAIQTLRSQGQLTKDPVALAREEAARSGQSGPEAQALVRSFDERQAATAAADKERTTQELGSGHAVESHREAADVLQRSIQSKAAEAKAGVDQAYDVVRANPTKFDATPVKNLGVQVNSDLRSLPKDPVFVSEKSTPTAQDMLDHMNGWFERLQKTGTQITAAEADRFRTELWGLRRNASTESDQRAAAAAMRGFDKRADAVMPSPELKAARAANTKYSQTFKSDDDVGKTIRQIVGDRDHPVLTPNDVSDKMFGTNGVNPNSKNLAAVNRVKQIVGGNSPEFTALKQGLFRKIVGGGPGEASLTSRQVSQRLNKFLHADGKEMADAVYSPQDKGLIQAYADLHKDLDVSVGTALSPEHAGVVSRITNFVSGKIGALVGSVIGHVGGALVGAPGIGEAIMEGVGFLAGGPIQSRVNAMTAAAQVRKQLPAVNEAVQKWQRALAAYNKANSPPARVAFVTATNSLARSLKPLGINLQGAFEPQEGTSNRQSFVSR